MSTVNISEELHAVLSTDVSCILGELYLARYYEEFGLTEESLQDFHTSLLEQLELEKLLTMYNLIDFNYFKTLISMYVLRMAGKSL